MKRLTLSAVLFAIALAVCANKTEYMMRPTADGYLFFIMPFSIPSEEKGVKPLTADITIPPNVLTADMRITVMTKEEAGIDSVRISNRDTAVTYPAKILYAEKRKKGWKYRIELTLPYETVTYIYSSPTPYTIGIIDGESIRASYSPAQHTWDKRRGEMEELFYVVEINKNNRKERK